MKPGNLPFEYPFRWRNEDLAAGAGVKPETAALLEQRDRDLEDFLATPGGSPITVVRRSTDQTIATSTSTRVIFDTEAIDDDDQFTASSDSIVIARRGRFLMVAGCDFAHNTTGLREIQILKNGTLVAHSEVDAVSGAGANTGLSASGVTVCVPGDVITLVAWQSSGSSLAINTRGETPFLATICL